MQLVLPAAGSGVACKGEGPGAGGGCMETGAAFSAAVVRYDMAGVAGRGQAPRDRGSLPWMLIRSTKSDAFAPHANPPSGHVVASSPPPPAYVRESRECRPGLNLRPSPSGGCVNSCPAGFEARSWGFGALG